MNRSGVKLSQSYEEVLGRFIYFDDAILSCDTTFGFAINLSTIGFVRSFFTSMSPGCLLYEIQVG